MPSAVSILLGCEKNTNMNQLSVPSVSPSAFIKSSTDNLPSPSSSLLAIWFSSAIQLISSLSDNPAFFWPSDLRRLLPAGSTSSNAPRTGILGIPQHILLAPPILYLLTHNTTEPSHDILLHPFPIHALALLALPHVRPSLHIRSELFRFLALLTADSRVLAPSPLATTGLGLLCPATAEKLAPLILPLPPSFPPITSPWGPALTLAVRGLALHDDASLDAARDLLTTQDGPPPPIDIDDVECAIVDITHDIRAGHAYVPRDPVPGGWVRPYLERPRRCLGRPLCPQDAVASGTALLHPKGLPQLEELLAGGDEAGAPYRALVCVLEQLMLRAIHALSCKPQPIHDHSGASEGPQLDDTDSPSKTLMGIIIRLT